MHWILLTMVTRLSWSLTNIGEKYMVDKRFKNPFVYAFLGFIAGLLGLVVVPFIEFKMVEFDILLWIILASFSFFVGVMFYIKAVQMEEVSRINLLWSFIPVFSLIGSAYILGETLTGLQFSAFIFLVLGGFIASLHAKSSGRFRFSRATILMIIGCASISIYDIVIRYLTNERGISFGLIFVYTSIIFVLLGFLLFISREFRRDFVEESKHFLQWKVLLLILGINMLSKIGLLFDMWALSLAPAPLVNSTEGVQAIFVFLITIFLTLSFPHIITEEIDKRNIILKVIAICFVVVGLVILSVAR